MNDLLHRWKPAARARTQILLAALLWTAVGTGLATAGVGWSLGAGGAWPVLLLAGGAAAGAAKGQWVLLPTARRSTARIVRRGDGTCVGGFVSWQSWVLVLAMMGLGMALRRSPIPRPVLGFLYTAVGTALLWGSRVYWREWGGRA